MASADKEVISNLRKLTECCICLMTYTDPRMLPCIHTACLKCSEELQLKNKKKPGDVLPCPMCRKEFKIPPKGMKGLQKNFFIENLMEVTNAANLECKSRPCDTCSSMEEAGNIAEATGRCLNCAENYCLRCSKMHKSQKVSKDHKIVEISGLFNDEEIRSMLPIRMCIKHSDKVLDYYCSDCKTVVCVSCFVEDHQTHKCKDVKTVDKDFRQGLEDSATKIHDYYKKMSSEKVNIEQKKDEFLVKTQETENAIRSKSDQLKALIDQNTKQLLDELSLLKQKHQKKMDMEIEEIERKMTVIESFVAYCSEVKSKGSPSEVCACVDNLISRAKELSKENEEYLSSEFISACIIFFPTDPYGILQNSSNIVGILSDHCVESSKEFESCVFAIGSRDDVLKIDLNRPENVSKLQQLPTKMQKETAAAIYRDSVFVTGLGNYCTEIWRFNAASSNWKKCAPLVRGRRSHSVAFVGHVLYICGGYVNFDRSLWTLDEVEAYNTVDDECAAVGKLFQPIHSSGNCAPYNTVLYIFGGIDANDEAISNIQVYDTKLNTCVLLSKPMPRADYLLRPIMWENVVILFGPDVCLLYNFETRIWQVRDQFKVDVSHFDVMIDKGNIFIIESDGLSESTLFRGKNAKIRYIPVESILNGIHFTWRDHSKLSSSVIFKAFGKIM